MSKPAGNRSQETSFDHSHRADSLGEDVSNNYPRELMRAKHGRDLSQHGKLWSRFTDRISNRRDATRTRRKHGVPVAPVNQDAGQSRRTVPTMKTPSIPKEQFLPSTYEKETETKIVNEKGGKKETTWSYVQIDWS